MAESNNFPAPDGEPVIELVLEPVVPAAAEAPAENPPVHTPPQDSEFGAPELLAAGAEEPAPAVPRRPLGIGRLLLAAALLGPLLGGSIGYALQSARPATPLPELEVVALQYPTTPADPAAAAAAALSPLAIDGDLRKLLIAKPDGAESWDNFGYGNDSGWLSAGEKAMSSGNPDGYFGQLISQGFRRDAIVTWRKGKTQWRVELIQYRSDHAASARHAMLDSADDQSTPLPGTASGVYLTPSEQKTYAESTEKFYYGLALAQRGDLVMQVSVFSDTQVNADELKDVAKRQWERLV